MNKILVMQMLRLGDIILSAPALRSLKDRFPESEVHLLFNSQFKNIQPLLPFVDKFIGFDRTKMQKCLRFKNVSYYGAFDAMKRLISYLKSQNYDQVINLTHNKMSGYIAGAVGCPNTLGLSIGKDKKAEFGNGAFRFLNDHGLSRNAGLIHYSDLYMAGSGNISSPRHIALRETEKGFSEIKGTVGHLDFQLVVQPLTNDVKKNWGLSNFEKFIYYYHQFNPNHKIALVGAPSEKKDLHALYNNLKEMRIPVYLVICSLEGALSLLRKTKVLVTGDTSIKHIAAATHTRIVELSMGSSHPQFTGAYKKNSYILQAKEACAPCDHSSACNHKLICHSKLDPQFVARTVSCIYARDSMSLNHIARKYKKHIDLYKTFIDYKFGWLAIPLALDVSSVYDILMTFCRSASMQGKNPHDYIHGFISNIESAISDKQEWASRIVQLKAEVDDARLPGSAFQMLKSVPRDNFIINGIRDFHVRAHGFHDIGEISNAQTLNIIFESMKSDLVVLNEIIKTIFKIERLEQWMNKLSNTSEIL